MSKQKSPGGATHPGHSQKHGDFEDDPIMSEPTYTVKAIPPKLQGMTVLAASVLHFKELLGELEDKLMGMHHLISAQVQILKAFSDLYEELTDESERRKFLGRAVLRAEREAARLRLPLWFWRAEPDLELKQQVFRRAKFLLFEHKAAVDDSFDLLREYCDSLRLETPVSDEQLSNVIEYAWKRGAH